MNWIELNVVQMIRCLPDDHVGTPGADIPGISFILITGEDDLEHIDVVKSSQVKFIKIPLSTQYKLH